MLNKRQFILLSMVLLLSFTLCAGAKPVKLNDDYNSYDHAYDGSTHIRFDLISHSLGKLFTSKIEGTAKRFSLECDADPSENRVEGCHIVIHAQDLDLDSGLGNKLLGASLDSKNYPLIIVNQLDPLTRSTESIRIEIQLKGKTRRIPTYVILKETSSELMITGWVKSTLSAFDIPKPKFPGSNGIMHLDDTIYISYRIIIPKHLLGISPAH